LEKLINKEQQLASNPDYSIWLSASAGSGKTKVLTDRVLLMLINKVKASKILCLTFTNAAATEMKERIHQQISKWATAKDGQIKLELSKLIGNPASAEQLRNAKNLITDGLKNLDNLNIYTIHSFCQKVLKQFSIEAGVAVNFKIMDEINQQQIFNNIKYSLITDPELENLNS